MKTPPLSIRLPAAERDALQAFATKHRMTLAGVARQAVADYIKRGGQNEAIHELQEVIQAEMLRLRKLHQRQNRDTAILAGLLSHFVKAYFVDQPEITDPETLKARKQFSRGRWDRFLKSLPESMGRAVSDVQELFKD